MAHDAGWTVLFGSCSGDGASAPGLVNQALTPLVADLPNHVIDAHVERCGGALAGLVPIMASRVPGLGPPGMTSRELPSVIHDAVVDLLRRTSELAPVTLILDDVTELMGAAVGAELDQRRRELAGVVHRQTDGNPFLIDDALRRLTGSAATFHLGRSSRIVLGTVGGIGLVAACAIIAAVGFGNQSGSVPDWVVFIAAAAFSTGVGLWFPLQVDSTVSVGPQARPSSSTP